MERRRQQSHLQHGQRGGHSLGGTTGQAGAGLPSAGSYVLVGGFWSSPPRQEICPPLISE
ncbi:MAG: hypothetical protein ACP5UQ_15425 [Anaerolineae bacterium]